MRWTWAWWMDEIGRLAPMPLSMPIVGLSSRRIGEVDRIGLEGIEFRSRPGSAETTLCSSRRYNTKEEVQTYLDCYLRQQHARETRHRRERRTEDGRTGEIAVSSSNLLRTGLAGLGRIESARLGSNLQTRRAAGLSAVESNRADVSPSFLPPWHCPCLLLFFAVCYMDTYVSALAGRRRAALSIRLTGI